MNIADFENVSVQGIKDEDLNLQLFKTHGAGTFV